MKCAVGDMALVIGGMPENVGKMVTIVRLCAGIIVGKECFIHNRSGPFWEIDRPLLYRLTNGSFRAVPYSCDEYLLPIRPERDESDEPAAMDLVRFMELNPAGVLR